MNKLKVITVVAIAALIISGSYYFSQKPKKGTNNLGQISSSSNSGVVWTTYINSRLRFSIKLPSMTGYEVVALDDPSSNFVYITEQKSGEPQKFSDLQRMNVRDWKIVVAKVKNNKELEGFIKEQYGPGCSLGEKTLTSNDPSSYLVKIVGNGDNKDDTTCYIAEAHQRVIYSPASGRVATWMGGQPTFIPQGFFFDAEIANSFKFE
ncbi:MAG: hypothetical protein NTY66_03465 [Candidatus Vogelbacteria bacterium]|nr:hypothetical protein [Candidatus Vogelbacteria bacterium]